MENPSRDLLNQTLFPLRKGPQVRNQVSHGTETRTHTTEGTKEATPKEKGKGTTMVDKGRIPSEYKLHPAGPTEHEKAVQKFVDKEIEILMEKVMNKFGLNMAEAAFVIHDGVDEWKQISTSPGTEGR